MKAGEGEAFCLALPAYAGLSEWFMVPVSKAGERLRFGSSNLSFGATRQVQFLLIGRGLVRQGAGSNPAELFCDTRRYADNMG